MINNIFLKNVNIPFAAYTKKKSYEAGLLNISGENKIEDYSIMAIKDKNSEYIPNTFSNENFCLIFSNNSFMIYSHKNLVNDCF